MLSPLRTVPLGYRLRSVAGVALVGAYLLVAARAMARGSYNIWGGQLLLPVLALLSVPILAALCRREPDPAIRSLLVVAFTLKLLAAPVRYWMAFGFYDGASDARVYDEYGIKIAHTIWSGHPQFELGAPFVGTGLIRMLTGLIYAVTGPSLFAGFLVFAWLGFWGLYLFYRAFVIAVPDGDVRLYARLVLLLPSMLFWPSSIGKEAVITLTLGLAAYGAARILTWARGGFLLFLLGVGGCALVRPHIALLVFGAVAMAYVLRRSRPDGGPLSRVTKVLGVLVMVAVGVLVLRSAQTFLGVDSFNSNTVNGWLDETARRTEQGGSSFSTAGRGTPLQYPMAVLTVLFRPLPFEATNVQTMLAAVEGTVLLWLTFRHRRRLRAAVSGLRRRPYLALCLIYTLLFSLAFSQISNFGIIARQRVQVIPFAIALICIRARSELSGAADQRPPRTSSPSAR